MEDEYLHGHMVHEYYVERLRKITHERDAARAQVRTKAQLMRLRDEVLRVLEGLREEKEIASNQEASVTIYSEDEELTAILNKFGLEQFAALCIVSEVKLQKGTGETTVAAGKSNFKKCQRCWNYWPSVGTDGNYPDLCRRCVETVKRLKG